MRAAVTLAQQEGWTAMIGEGRGQEEEGEMMPGGSRGCYVRPTLLIPKEGEEERARKSSAWTTEIFGPVLCMMVRTEGT